MNLFFKIIGLIFFVIFLESCGPAATVHYNKCSQAYSNFEDIARCGKVARNQSCQAYGNCSSMGNALVQYADTLAYGVKTGESELPSIKDGLSSQAVIEAAIESINKKKWESV